MAQRQTIEYRTVDGSGNNKSDPSLNTPGTDFSRVGPANFADGFNSLQPGPNARQISNLVVAGGPTEGGLGGQRPSAVGNDVRVGSVH